MREIEKIRQEIRATIENTGLTVGRINQLEAASHVSPEAEEFLLPLLEMALLVHLIKDNLDAINPPMGYHA